MSIHKADPLNEERGVIDNLLASSQNLMGNSNAQYPPSSSQYHQTTPAKNKMTMKSRRGRTSYSQAQLSDLEDAFKNTHYPDFQTRKELSIRLKIPDDRIQVWFQNRRAKYRKMQRQIYNGYHGNQTTGVQNADTIMLVHSNQNERQPAGTTHDGIIRGRPSPIQHTTVGPGIKEETTVSDFNRPPQAANSMGNHLAESMSQQHHTKQEKWSTPHTIQQHISENQRTAPSLYSLSATITSTGQYIILGDNPQSNIPTTGLVQTTSTKY